MIHDLARSSAPFLFYIYRRLPGLFQYKSQDANWNSRQWGLVIAGISDFQRPVEKLSLTQNAALTATGLIWTRWCMIIKPRNYL